MYKVIEKDWDVIKYKYMFYKPVASEFELNKFKLIKSEYLTLFILHGFILPFGIACVMVALLVSTISSNHAVIWGTFLSIFTSLKFYFGKKSYFRYRKNEWNK